MENVRALIGSDIALMDLLDEALQRPGLNPYGCKGKPENGVDNVNAIARPTGNTSDAGLRRLRKDRPDLHAAVISDQLSVHAACVQAGFRRKTVTVPLDPVRAVQALVRHFSQEETSTGWVYKLTYKTGQPPSRGGAAVTIAPL